MRSFVSSAALAALASSAAVELQQFDQAVVAAANSGTLMGYADFEFTWEKKTSTTLKVTIKNTYDWAGNDKFEDLVANTDTNKDEMSFESCVIDVEYTTAAPKYMCFYNRMIKNDTAGSGQNPTVSVNVKRENQEKTIWTFSQITTGNINALPTVPANGANVVALCTDMIISLQGDVTTSAEYTGTGAVTKKVTDTATSGYSCTLDTSATTRTKTQLVITTIVEVTSTEAKITAWETNLTNDGHKGCASVTLKDDTAYGYFGRADMMYVNKSAVSTATSLGKANTALTGDLSLAASVFASAAALYASLSF